MDSTGLGEGPGPEPPSVGRTTLSSEAVDFPESTPRVTIEPEGMLRLSNVTVAGVLRLTGVEVTSGSEALSTNRPTTVEVVEERDCRSNEISVTVVEVVVEIEPFPQPRITSDGGSRSTVPFLTCSNVHWTPSTPV